MLDRLSDLIKVDNNGNIISNQWIEWYHFGIRNLTGAEREKDRKTMKKFRHCEKCTLLSGCYFLERNMPPFPLHLHCDCKKKYISYDKDNHNAYAECDITKFTKYVFTDNAKSKGKSELFDMLGYTISDSKFLQNEFCRQALEQYKLGNYKLKGLDENAQRLAIPMEINGYKFYSGWKLEPQGKIKNTTPFGGWIK